MSKKPLFTALPLGFFLIVFSAFSQNARTLVSMIDTTCSMTTCTDKEMVLTGKSELHLTATSDVLNNSIICLNNDDSWLFLDNIRPAAAISSILPYVYVKSSAGVNKSNIRVAIYKNGSVLIPQPPSFQPLTVYTGQNGTGDSARYNLFTKYSSLGTNIDNKIRSFKLKRGYMATLATSADGTGYSRVFIADDADLIFNTLPSELDQVISMIRVLNWEWTSKKGWCGTGSGGITDCEKVDGTWSYTWSADQNSTAGVEYVPMRPKLTWPGWTEINGKQYVTHVLGLNEPDHPEQHKDDNDTLAVTVSQALAQWPDMLRTGLRVGSPACTNFSWLYSFMDSCKARNYRVDYVTVHAYWNSKTPINWYNDLKNIHEKTGRPIWITEWNNGANWTTEWWPTDSLARLQKQLSDITGILNVLDTAHFVERYSIYNWVENKRAMLINGVLTPAGSYYKANKSKIAFQRVNEVIPTFIFGKSTLGINVGTKVVTLSIVDPNGEYFRGFTMERKVGNGNWDIFFDSSISTSKSTTDSINRSLPGGIRYRTRCKRSDGSFSAYTNEVGFDVTSGGSVQYGLAKINNISWNTVLFSQPYTNFPAIITGAPTNKNSTVLFCTRAKLITMSGSFNLQMIPWSYQNITSVANEETVPYLSCAPGNHDFGGLKAEAGRNTINSTWTAVSFKTPFDTIPVVFSTQLLSATTYPTTVRIRNVTKTGFEARIAKEATNTSTLAAETVSYFAITPGTGVIENHKVRVGWTNPLGLLLTTVQFGDTISNPLFISQLQTCNDDNAAILRTHSITSNYAYVIKQPEKSSGISYVKYETGGWIVMDLDSEGTDLAKTSSEKLHLYPNPVTDCIHLGKSFPEGIVVTIYNLFGYPVNTIHLVGDKIDVQHLPKGCYLMRSTAFGSAKFLKQ
jgi:hypothetical protein